MAAARHITFFHSPNTRSTGVLALLEELDADYELQVLNMKVGEHRNAAYLAINPMGKVPAIRHGIEAYIRRETARPAFTLAREKDAQLAAAQAAKPAAAS